VARWAARWLETAPDTELDMHMRARPKMVFADANGTIYDHPVLEMAGVDGGVPVPVSAADLVSLPRGSDVFVLPGRTPIGIDPESGRPVEYRGEGTERAATAVAAFLAPAHTLSHLPAYSPRPFAAALPLFAYAAVGFLDGELVAAGLRVDPDPRQDPWRFDRRRLEKQVHKRMASAAAAGGSRLIEQLERCALTYGCRAAQNYFIGRHEAPLPTSVTCNAQCVGCISLQTDGQFRASHDRLDRAPTPSEVTAVALEHIERVPEAIVSFGQGCEGEPLLSGELLIESTRMIRAATDAGTIHLNSNASKPEVVDELAATGLDSMRVSMNSARPEIYAAYYRPHKYGFEDVMASMAAMKRRGRFLSINYLVFPGVTDTEAEVEALEELIAATGLDLVQLRNLNIDPEAYFACLPPGTMRPGFGIRRLMARLQARFPRLRFGYFNPPKERYTAWRTATDAVVAASG
jgi:wyosine [tRNA(Phe)-imidazoG37] synthetase (radical SAM superfamily)